MLTRQFVRTALVAAMGIAAGGGVFAADADIVIDWNTQTEQSVRVGGRRGPSGAFDFAMVHAAMHDAVQAIEQKFERYCGTGQTGTGSPVGAAATAAHDVLVALFPSQKDALDRAYAASLAKYNVAPLDDGIAVGQGAAACVLVRLAADNRARAQTDTFIGEHAIGAWRPTSLRADGSEVPMIAEFVASFAPYTLRASDQFRLSQGPPPLTSGAYAKAYNEVKTMGEKTGSSRTDDQTNLALFFADSATSYWNRALQDVAGRKGLDLGDNARLFALVNLAMSDAIISAWDSKIAWNFWRPVTAIRQGELDGNSNTIGQDGTDAWTPLLATPNYPDYTSGANNFSGAATTMLANFFGTDEVAFTMTSNTVGAPHNVREYTRCSEAAQDVVEARIYAGIHFRFADSTAMRQGAHVANWAFGHFLRPID